MLYAHRSRLRGARSLARLGWAPALTAAGCLSMQDPVDDPPRSTAQALGGIEGTFEYSLDAPWRIEPEVRQGIGATYLAYAPIPLQVTLHDGDQVGDDAGGFINPDLTPRPAAIGSVCDLTVTEYVTGAAPIVRRIPIEQFQEVERTVGAWRYDVASQPGGPPRQRCEATSTSNCALLNVVSGTSEWHGLALYTPSSSTPRNVALTLELRVTRGPTIACANAAPTELYTLRNHVRVRLAPAPLPRPSSGAWAYGDLHYHSQGTDNEGESAYNYRGVSRAMKALGIDFLWATEHASSSAQLTDVDASLGLNPNSLDVRARRTALRDMDSRRFRAHQAIVAETNLATAMRQPTGRLSTATGNIPQIYLGGEVDVIPETATAPGTPIPWGGARTYDVSQLCGGWRGEISSCSPSSSMFRQCNVNLTCASVGVDCGSCNPNNLWSSAGANTWFVRDVQGLNEFDYGREHMVYLPDPSPPSGVDPFVASFTGTYGGAQRRLADASWISGDANHAAQLAPGVLQEVEAKRGSVFLAHHLNTPGGSNGPEGPPWSPSMVDRAWRSPAVLGFEFWNEDRRRYSTVRAANVGVTAQGWETGYERDDSQWWTSLHLVEQGRAGLRPGGAGAFELYPFAYQGDTFGYANFGFEEKLVEGCYAWDRINLRGLDPRETASLSWLPAGQPRRMFMAGGSDAHGDFNYRREGYMTGTSEVNDSAIATPRNLVLAGAPQQSLAAGAPPTFGAGQVLTALRAGHFSVTDGPALRVVYDTNRNGVIDANEPTMGDVLDLTSGATVPLLVEWVSTAEFGSIDRVELVVGAYNSTTGASRLYRGHRGPDPSVGVPAVETYGLNGWTYRRFPDGYWQAAPDGVESAAASDLLDDPPIIPSGLYRGVTPFTLDLSRFHVAPGATPDRIFVRAFVRTDRGPNTSDTLCASQSVAARSGQCIRRLAFSNPLWARFTAPFVIETPNSFTP